MIGPFPLDPVPEVDVEVTILARNKGIDPLLAGLRISDDTWHAPNLGAFGGTLIGPIPLPPVPEVDVEVAIRVAD